MVVRNAGQWRDYFDTDTEAKKRFRYLATQIHGILPHYGYFTGRLSLKSYSKDSKSIVFEDRNKGISYTFDNWFVTNPVKVIHPATIKDSKPKTATKRTVHNYTKEPYEAENTYEYETSTETTDTSSSQIEAGFGLHSSFTGGISGATESSFGATALVTMGFDINFMSTTFTEIAKAIAEEQEKGANGTMVVPGGRSFVFQNTHETCLMEMKVDISGVQDCKVKIDLTGAKDKAPNPDKKGQIWAIKPELHSANSIEQICQLLLDCYGNPRTTRNDIWNRAMNYHGVDIGKRITNLMNEKRRTVGETNVVQFPKSDEFVTTIREVEQK